jgi:hypothetical protein
MTIKLNGAFRRRFVGSAVGGLIAFAFVPAATAQWLPPWPAVFPGEIAPSLEAQGYILTAPLMRRPGVYLADVSTGPAGYQRLVIDARSGQILERFVVRGRMWAPGSGEAFATEEFPAPHTITPAGRSAYNAPANVHIPAAISPYGAGETTAGTKPKAKSVSAGRMAPANRAATLIVNPPLPPPAPREATEGSGSSTSKPAESHEAEPKIDFRPAEVNNAPPSAPPTALGSSAAATD